MSGAATKTRSDVGMALSPSSSVSAGTTAKKWPGSKRREVPRVPLRTLDCMGGTASGLEEGGNRTWITCMNVGVGCRRCRSSSTKGVRSRSPNVQSPAGRGHSHEMDLRRLSSHDGLDGNNLGLLGDEGSSRLGTAVGSGMRSSTVAMRVTMGAVIGRMRGRGAGGDHLQMRQHLGKV